MHDDEGPGCQLEGQQEGESIWILPDPAVSGLNHPCLLSSCISHDATLCHQPRVQARYPCLPVSGCWGSEPVLGLVATILIAQAACRFQPAGTQGRGALLASGHPRVPASAWGM